MKNEKVRSDTAFATNYKKQCTNTYLSTMSTPTQMCHRCHRSGHLVSVCHATSTAHGEMLGDSTDEESEKDGSQTSVFIGSENGVEHVERRSNGFVLPSSTPITIAPRNRPPPPPCSSPVQLASAIAPRHIIGAAIQHALHKRKYSKSSARELPVMVCTCCGQLTIDAPAWFLHQQCEQCRVVHERYNLGVSVLKQRLETEIKDIKDSFAARRVQGYNQFNKKK